jgi:hypothetical protein
VSARSCQSDRHSRRTGTSSSVALAVVRDYLCHAAGQPSCGGQV